MSLSCHLMVTRKKTNVNFANFFDCITISLLIYLFKLIVSHVNYGTTRGFFYVRLQPTVDRGEPSFRYDVID